MPVEYIFYLPIVVMISIILISKAKNKAFLGLFILWLFCSPIFMNPRYTISLSFFGIDIQPNRFLFLTLTPLLYILILTPRRVLHLSSSPSSTGLKISEKFLIGYILIVIFTLVLNISSLGSRKVIVDISNAIAFIVVYFCSRKLIKNEDFILFQVAILTFAVISAIVAIYQFFINPEFFRLGVVRAAFSDYYRSNGLFTAEYDQGMFLIFSIVTAISMNLRRWIKILFISVVFVGIFVTMHRLSWAATIFTLGLIWFFYLRKNLLTYILVPIIVIVVIYGALNVPWSQMAIGRFSSSLITERIFADTLSGRFSQYRFSFYAMKEYPLGIGGYNTPFYNQIAYNQGVPLSGTSSEGYYALVVHNGFLSAGVKYGILGLILFTLFIFTSIFHFLKQSIQKGKRWYPLLMIILIFAIFNLTNDFSSLGTQIGVTLAWLLGGYVSANSTNYVAEVIAQPINLEPLNY